MMGIDFLTSQVAQQFTWVLVHFLWQGLLVAILYGLVSRSIDDAAKRYVVGMLALAVMAACPILTFTTQSTLGVGRVGAIPRQSTSTRSKRQVAALTSPTRDSLPAAILSSPRESMPLPGPSSSWLLLRTITQPVILGLYLLGTGWMSLRLGVSWVASQRLLRQTEPAPAELLERLSSLGQKFGIVVADRLRIALRMDEAGVVGLWRPCVLLPAAWLTQLPPQALEAIVAHELAHVRRWDAWGSLVQRLVESLLFYHPAVWWVSRQVRQHREMCCDGAAVTATQRRADYVEALASAARLRVDTPLPQGAAAFRGDSKMRLLERVQRLLGQPTRRTSAMSLLAATIPMLCCLALAIGLSTVDAQDGDPPKRDGDRPVKRDGDRPVQRDGDRPVQRDGDRPVQRDGDRPVQRDGDRPVQRDGDRPVRRDGDRPVRGDRPVEGQRNLEFRPETAREAALYRMILGLQREMAALRQQVEGSSSDRETTRNDRARLSNGESRQSVERYTREIRRDGDRETPRNGDREIRRDGDRETPRDGDREIRRDGDREMPRDGDRERYTREIRRDGDRGSAERDEAMAWDLRFLSTLAQQFDRADTSRNQKLSNKELVNWLQPNGNEARERGLDLLRKAAGEDGEMTRDELLRVVTQRRKEHLDGRNAAERREGERREGERREGDRREGGRDRDAAVPRSRVNGTVIQIDRTGRLAQLSVGANDGVKAGQTFNISRGDKVLGRVVIKQAAADSAIGQITLAKEGQDVKPGDKVAY